VSQEDFETAASLESSFRDASAKLEAEIASITEINHDMLNQALSTKVGSDGQ
jgi:hypothetical protein